MQLLKRGDAFSVLGFIDFCAIALERRSEFSLAECGLGGKGVRLSIYG